MGKAVIDEVMKRCKEVGITEHSMAKSQVSSKPRNWRTSPTKQHKRCTLEKLAKSLVKLMLLKTSQTMTMGLQLCSNS